MWCGGGMVWYYWRREPVGPRALRPHFHRQRGTSRRPPRVVAPRPALSLSCLHAIPPLVPPLHYPLEDRCANHRRGMSAFGPPVVALLPSVHVSYSACALSCCSALRFTVFHRSLALVAGRPRALYVVHKVHLVPSPLWPGRWLVLVTVTSRGVGPVMVVPSSVPA